MKHLPYQKEFLSFLKDQKYSISTTQSYKYGLIDFTVFLQKDSINLRDLLLDDIGLYINFLHERNKSNSSININLSCLKKYFDFLVKNNKIILKFDYNNIKQIKTNKQDRKQIDIENFNKILYSINKKKDLSSKRDFIIFQLIIKTGIRISELVKIKKGNFNNGQIIVDNNIYILDENLNKQIENFINNSQNKKKSLFIPYRARKDLKDNGLTTRSIERMIKKYFPDNNYNDLKLIYFKEICEDLPNITKICRHKFVSKINLKEINKII